MHRHLGAALLCATALAASAPAAAAPQKSSDVGFFVAPVGTPSLRFVAQPGEQTSGRVRIENLSGSPRTIRLTTSDLVTADTGGASFPAEAPKAVGTWLELDRAKVHLSPGAHAIVGFRAVLPSTAEPGEHYAGIVAVDAADAAAAERPAQGEGVEIRHLARLALPVRLTVPGPLTRRLALTDMQFTVDASGSSLRVELQNAGNQSPVTPSRDPRSSVRLLRGRAACRGPLRRARTGSWCRAW